MVVNIKYFDAKGQFYSNGEYTTEKEHMQDVFEEVAGLFEKGIKPGLANKGNFLAYVDVPNHKENYPHIFYKL